MKIFFFLFSIFLIFSCQDQIDIQKQAVYKNMEAEGFSRDKLSKLSGIIESVTFIKEELRTSKVSSEKSFGLMGFGNFGDFSGFGGFYSEKNSKKSRLFWFDDLKNDLGEILRILQKLDLDKEKDNSIDLNYSTELSILFKLICRVQKTLNNFLGDPYFLTFECLYPLGSFGNFSSLKTPDKDPNKFQLNKKKVVFRLIMHLFSKFDPKALDELNSLDSRLESLESEGLNFLEPQDLSKNYPNLLSFLDEKELSSIDYEGLLKFASFWNFFEKNKNLGADFFRFCIGHESILKFFEDLYGIYESLSAVEAIRKLSCFSEGYGFPQETYLSSFITDSDLFNKFISRKKMEQYMRVFEEIKNLIKPSSLEPSSLEPDSEERKYPSKRTSLGDLKRSLERRSLYRELEKASGKTKKGLRTSKRQKVSKQAKGK